MCLDAPESTTHSSPSVPFRLIDALESFSRTAQLCSIALLAPSIKPVFLVRLGDSPLPPEGVGKGPVLRLLLPLLALFLGIL